MVDDWSFRPSPFRPYVEMFMDAKNFQVGDTVSPRYGTEDYADMERDSVSEVWERSLRAINVQMQSRMLDPLLALLERGIVQLENTRAICEMAMIVVFG